MDQEHRILNRVDSGGTLLWIGDRDALAFRDAYRSCERSVSQIAYRRSADEALARAATEVRTIVGCLDHDDARVRTPLARLMKVHPDAQTVLIAGPLCLGCRPGPGETLGVPVVPWHEWQAKLPNYLSRCGWVSGRDEPPPASIAIVTDHAAEAQALMTLASAGGACVVWCRGSELGTVRSFAEYWWDDTAKRGRTWEACLRGRRGQGIRHVWLTACPTPRAVRMAKRHGIDQVIGKPGDYQSLIRRIAGDSGVANRRAA